MSDSIARGALSLLTTQPLTWGASLIMATVFPRLLGADLLGQVAFTSTIAQLAGTVAGLGMAEFLVRRVAQQPKMMRRDLGLALCVLHATTIIAALVIALAGPHFTSSIVDSRILLLALLPMLAGPAQSVLLSSYRGAERHSSYAAFNAAIVVLTTLASTLVLLMGGSIYTAMFASGTLLLVVIAAGWKLSGIRPSLPTPTRESWRESQALIYGGLPFLAWGLTQVAYLQLDRLILGSLVSTTEVGWYAASARIIAIPIFIPTLVITPLFPALSRSVHDATVIRRSIAQALKVVLLLTVPLSAGIVAVAPRIPSLFGWPADFANAVPLMRIMAMQVPLVSIGMVLGVAVMSIGRERRLVALSCVAIVFSATCNMVLIRVLEQLTGNGAIGAAIVMVLSEVVMLVGTLLLIPRDFLEWSSVTDALKIFGAGLAIVLVGLILEPIALVVCIAGGAVTYVLVGTVLRLLTIGDLRRGIQYVKSRRGHRRAS